MTPFILSIIIKTQYLSILQHKVLPDITLPVRLNILLFAVIYSTNRATHPNQENTFVNQYLFRITILW